MTNSSTCCSWVSVFFIGTFFPISSADCSLFLLGKSDEESNFSFFNMVQESHILADLKSMDSQPPEEVLNSMRSSLWEHYREASLSY